MFEVEQKFRLPDPAAFLKRVAEIGLSWKKKVVEADTYFQHPCRDFVQTDEALRVRRHLTFFFGDSENTQLECCPERAEAEQLITFKGPRLDRQAKIRKEIELPLAASLSLDPARAGTLFSMPAETLWDQLDALEGLSVSRQWMEIRSPRSLSSRTPRRAQGTGWNWRRDRGRRREKRAPPSPATAPRPPGLGWRLGPPLAGALSLRDLVLAGVRWLESIAPS